MNNINVQTSDNLQDTFLDKITLPVQSEEAYDLQRNNLSSFDFIIFLKCEIARLGNDFVLEYCLLKGINMAAFSDVVYTIDVLRCNYRLVCILFNLSENNQFQLYYNNEDKRDLERLEKYSQVLNKKTLSELFIYHSMYLGIIDIESLLGFEKITSKQIVYHFKLNYCKVKLVNKKQCPLTWKVLLTNNFELVATYTNNISENLKLFESYLVDSKDDLKNNRIKDIDNVFRIFCKKNILHNYRKFIEKYKDLLFSNQQYKAYLIKGLDNDPMFRYKQNTNISTNVLGLCEDNSCPICYEPSKTMYILGCGHGLCKSCLKKIKDTCPTCRKPIESCSYSK
jgi:hypothetical protein